MKIIPELSTDKALERFGYLYEGLNIAMDALEDRGIVSKENNPIATCSTHLYQYVQDKMGEIDTQHSSKYLGYEYARVTNNERARLKYHKNKSLKKASNRYNKNKSLENKETVINN